MNALRVGLWNTGKTGNKELLVAELQRYNIYNCGVCEPLLTGTDCEDMDGWFFISSGVDRTHIYGVRLVLSRRTKVSLVSYETINEKILRARLYGKQVKITTIVAYPSAEDAEDDVNILFYEDLQSITLYCSKT